MMTSCDFRGTGLTSENKDDDDPTEVREPTVDGGDTQMNETTAGSDQNSVKKHKTRVPVPPDDFVVDRIKTLKKTIGGLKCEDNKWTEMLRKKLDGPDTTAPLPTGPAPTVTVSTPVVG